MKGCLKNQKMGEASRKVASLILAAMAVLCFIVIYQNSFPGIKEVDTVSRVESGSTISPILSPDPIAWPQADLDPFTGTQPNSDLIGLPEKDPDAGQNTEDGDVQAVRALVEEFGKKMKMVSLTVPDDVAKASIQEHYGNDISNSLLEKWQNDPQSSLGRRVSSPWPDRIDIMGMEKWEKGYMVKGEIIELTSVELANGGAAAKQPIELEVERIGGHWLINGVSLGNYVTTDPVSYENSQYGFCFYLPESWQGYTIITGEWEGMKEAEMVTTGPLLSIRHPDWSSVQPRQDIPIMVYTQAQWDALQRGEFFVSAAPINPRELGHNSVYVFALPARYNFAFPVGFEEVEEILAGSPLWPAPIDASAQ